MGCVCDQAVIWELFDEVEKAAEVLGRASDSEVGEITAVKAKLYMPKTDTLGGLQICAFAAGEQTEPNQR